MTRTVQVRYFFSADSFPEETLEVIKMRVESYNRENYQLKDGKSSGSTWILEPLPNRSNRRGEPLYFGESISQKGYSIGASGARIIVTLLNALETRGLKRGIAAICIGGGEGTAIALERV